MHHMFQDPSQSLFYICEATDGSACRRGSGAGTGPPQDWEPIWAVLSEEAGSSSTGSTSPADHDPLRWTIRTRSEEEP